MSLGVAILIALAVTMLAALALLAWMVRTVIREAHALDEDEIGDESKRRSLFGWLNPIAWWRREQTIRLFYQRDEKGRFRKVRRH